MERAQERFQESTLSSSTNAEVSQWETDSDKGALKENLKCSWEFSLLLQLRLPSPTRFFNGIQVCWRVCAQYIDIIALITPQTLILLNRNGHKEVLYLVTVSALRARALL